jgi:hypothetical protein
MPMPRNKTEDDITAEVLQRFSAIPDPRLNRSMKTYSQGTCSPAVTAPKFCTEKGL